MYTYDGCLHSKDKHPISEVLLRPITVVFIRNFIFYNV